MNVERYTIKNRHGLKLVIQVDTPDDPRNLAFVMPGQGGTIENEVMAFFAQAFLENNFRTVRFDPTHSIGESEGDIKDVTYTAGIEDLHDVISWARGQSWFKQPFALSGHSLGAIATALYAEHHPGEVLCLAPISTVLDHDTFLATLDEDFVNEWKEKGYYESQSKSKPGVINKIGYQIMTDMKKYNLLTAADRITMPVLLMAGENDNSTPYWHQKIFFDAIPSTNKKLVKVLGADHNFQGSAGDTKKLEEVKDTISDWLKTLGSNT